MKVSATFSRPEWIWLAVITLIGTAIRIVYQMDRPFIADEIGTLKYIEASYGYLLTHHDTWLTINFFLMAEKFLADVFGPTPAALTALPLLFGVATLPLAALLARRFMEPAPSLAAALLAALNPYLINQSLNIRSYSMLTALSLAAILLFLRWQDDPGWRNGARFALAAFFLLLMHLAGVYLLGALGTIFIAGTIANLRLAQNRNEQWAVLRRAGSLVLPALAAGLAVAAAYAPSMISGFQGEDRFLDTPPTPLFNLSFVWTQYFGNGFWGWPAAAFILVGIWRAVAQAAPIRFLLPPLLLGPVFMSLQGRSYFPWSCARHLVYTVPLLLLFAAYGISWLVPQKRKRLWALALATLVAASWTPETIWEFGRKDRFPWHQVRKHLATAGGPDSLAIALDWETNFQLDPRPAPPVYKRVPIGKLQPAEFEGMGRDNPSAPIFVVLKQIESALPREAARFGLLAVLTYPPSGYREFLEALRGDLAALVAGLPTEPEYAPLYDALVEIARRLGDRRDIEMYMELSRAAGSRSLQSREATERMLEIDAEQVAKRWRRK